MNLQQTASYTIQAVERLAGDDIILIVNLSENICDGKIARLLGAEGLCVEEIVQKPTGQKIHHNHIRGSKPITGTLATPGIVCSNS